MKKTLNTIALALVMITSMSSFAAEKVDPSKYEESRRTVVNYLQTTTLGSMDVNTALFADDFEYSNQANGTSHTKNQYVRFLKANKGKVYNCSTSYEILDQAGGTCIAKATLVFDHFTRVDYITLNQTGQAEWQISKVVTTYP